MAQSTYLSHNFAKSDLVPIDWKKVSCSLAKALFPPYSAYSRRGGCKNLEFWLCVVLMCLGYFPGLIYAVYTVYKEDIAEDGKNREIVVNNVSDNQDSTTAAAT